jgi:hypothetical protein
MCCSSARRDRNRLEICLLQVTVAVRSSMNCTNTLHCDHPRAKNRHHSSPLVMAAKTRAARTRRAMRWKPNLTAIILLVAMVVSPEFGPALWAQTATPTAQQLDQLLAPVALYPDSLLAQITTASTNPQEILDVDNWLQQNPGLSGTALTDAAEQQGFDPAFIALTNFPQVLDMMAQNIDDYAAIGEVFSADQGAVTASIQRLRAQAYAAGALRSNEQQQVEVQQPAGQTIYVIQPANPQVVYVPVYNPTVVYVRPSSSTVVVTSLITFGAGIAIGALLVDNRPWGWGGWGWSWGSHRAYYNHVVWVGWGNPYRPPNVWYRPRPVPYTGRPGYGGNWHYRPPNYRPPAPAPRPPNRPPWGPSNPPGHRPPAGGRPPAPKPKPGQPTHPIAKPTPKPPGSTKPTTRPTTKPPAKPTTGKPSPPAQGKPDSPGGNRPPVNGSKPPDTTRPAPQPKPKPMPEGTAPPKTKPATPPGTTRPGPQPKPKPTPEGAAQPKPKSTAPPATTRPATQAKPAPKPAPSSGSPPPKQAPAQSKPAPKPAPKSQPKPPPQPQPQTQPKN